MGLENLKSSLSNINTDVETKEIVSSKNSNLDNLETFVKSDVKNLNSDLDNVEEFNPQRIRTLEGAYTNLDTPLSNPTGEEPISNYETMDSDNDNIVEDWHNITISTPVEQNALSEGHLEEDRLGKIDDYMMIDGTVIDLTSPFLDENTITIGGSFQNLSLAGASQFISTNANFYWTGLTGPQGGTFAASIDLNTGGWLEDTLDILGIDDQFEINFDTTGILTPFQPNYDATVWDRLHPVDQIPTNLDWEEIDPVSSPTPQGPFFNNVVRGVAFQTIGPINNPSGFGAYPQDLYYSSVMGQIETTRNMSESGKLEELHDQVMSDPNSSAEEREHYKNLLESTKTGEFNMGDNPLLFGSTVASNVSISTMLEEGIKQINANGGALDFSYQDIVIIPPLFDIMQQPIVEFDFDKFMGGMGNNLVNNLIPALGSGFEALVGAAGIVGAIPLGLVGGVGKILGGVGGAVGNVLGTAGRGIFDHLGDGPNGKGGLKALWEGPEGAGGLKNLVLKPVGGVIEFLVVDVVGGAATALVDWATPAFKKIRGPKIPNPFAGNDKKNPFEKFKSSDNMLSEMLHDLGDFIKGNQEFLGETMKLIEASTGFNSPIQFNSEAGSMMHQYMSMNPDNGPDITSMLSYIGSIDSLDDISLDGILAFYNSANSLEGPKAVYPSIANRPTEHLPNTTFQTIPMTSPSITTPMNIHPGQRRFQISMKWQDSMYSQVSDGVSDQFGNNAATEGFDVLFKKVGLVTTAQHIPGTWTRDIDPNAPEKQRVTYGYGRGAGTPEIHVQGVDTFDPSNGYAPGLGNTTSQQLESGDVEGRVNENFETIKEIYKGGYIIHSDDVKVKIEAQTIQLAKYNKLGAINYSAFNAAAALADLNDPTNSGIKYKPSDKINKNNVSLSSLESEDNTASVYDAFANVEFDLDTPFPSSTVRAKSMVEAEKHSPRGSAQTAGVSLAASLKNIDSAKYLDASQGAHPERPNTHDNISHNVHTAEQAYGKLVGGEFSGDGKLFSKPLPHKIGGKKTKTDVDQFDQLIKIRNALYAGGAGLNEPGKQIQEDYLQINPGETAEGTLGKMNQFPESQLEDSNFDSFKLNKPSKIGPYKLGLKLGSNQSAEAPHKNASPINVSDFANSSQKKAYYGGDVLFYDNNPPMDDYDSLGTSKYASMAGEVFYPQSHGGKDPHTLRPLLAGTTLSKAYSDVDVNTGVNKVESPTQGIPFYFKDLRDNTYIVFRAYIEGINENVSPQWGEQQYVGRSEQVYTYNQTTRDINFTLKLMAESLHQLDTIYNKMNRLTALCYPEYKLDDTFKTDGKGKHRMKPPLCSFRLGDLYGNNSGNMTGFIRSLNYNIDPSATWEHRNGKRVPKFVTVTIGFQPLGGLNFEVPDFKSQFYGYIGTTAKTPKRRYKQLTSDAEISAGQSI